MSRRRSAFDVELHVLLTNNSARGGVGGERVWGGECDGAHHDAACISLSAGVSKGWLTI